ncbi:uncharacterized protein LOC114357709 [Ostrinia furnacalis]|uniref:uncharacterized protein LOC114357709 n=1 Tax=Ostrinia furnacalis TaxID=93504 RepID=UPI00103B237A|nr:uncharacterized protein LOC114357709 [Ostrinia furnacalis]
MSQDAKRTWKCPECVSRLPKSDNTNTPLRALSSSGTAGGGADGSDTDDQISNVTLRNKSKTSGIQTSDGDLHAQKYVTEATLRAVIRQELASTLKASISEHLADEISGVKLQLIEFQNSLTFFNKTFEDLRKENSDLRKAQSNILTELKVVKSENSSLKKDLASCTSRIKHLEEECSRQQQWTRLQNIELVGIPENKLENTTDVATKIFKHIGVNITPDDMEFAHRVQPRRPASAGRGRAIIVRLKQRAIKDQIIAAARKRRTIVAKDVELGKDTDLIYVNEHLTRENKGLLAACKLKAKESGFKYIWTKNCRIFARRSDSTPPIVISSTADLEKIA